MNIIDIKTYPKYLLLLGVVLLSASCHREDNPSGRLPQTDIPICFLATSEWPELTKAPIIGTETDNDEGVIGYESLPFYVWGRHLQFDPLIFNNIEVTYDDTYGWTYDGDAKYWTIGQYSFTSVMFAQNYDHDINCEFDDSGKSKINFVEPYNLLENQTDVMFAHTSAEYTVENFNSQSEKTVDLEFTPQLSMVSFQIYNKIGTINSTLNITELKFEGLHSSASSWSSTEGWTYYEDVIEPYSFDCDVEIAFGGNEFVVSNCLVFPEQTELTVTVTYTESLPDATNGIPTGDITKSTAPFSVEWACGKRYVYPLTITETEIIFFGEPTVTEWGDGGSAGNIEIK